MSGAMNMRRSLSCISRVLPIDVASMPIARHLPLQAEYEAVWIGRAKESVMCACPCSARGMDVRAEQDSTFEA